MALRVGLHHGSELWQNLLLPSNIILVNVWHELFYNLPKDIKTLCRAVSRLWSPVHCGFLSRIGKIFLGKHTLFIIQAKYKLIWILVFSVSFLQLRFYLVLIQYINDSIIWLISIRCFIICIILRNGTKQVTSEIQITKRLTIAWCCRWRPAVTAGIMIQGYII